jgi:hypothetical protein
MLSIVLEISKQCQGHARGWWAFSKLAHQFLIILIKSLEYLTELGLFFFQVLNQWITDIS